MDSDVRRRTAVGWLAAVGLALTAAAGAADTTTTTTSTSTTTTLACTAEASIPSAQCRLGQLGDLLAGRGTTAPGNTVLSNQIARALKNVNLANALTGKKAKSKLKSAVGALKSFNARLRSAAGKKQVDSTMRQALQAISGQLQKDLDQLRRTP